MPDPRLQSGSHIQLVRPAHTQGTLQLPLTEATPPAPLGPLQPACKEPSPAQQRVQVHLTAAVPSSLNLLQPLLPLAA